MNTKNSTGSSLFSLEVIVSTFLHYLKQLTDIFSLKDA